jgi:hypothetical protein
MGICSILEVGDRIPITRCDSMMERVYFSPRTSSTTSRVAVTTASGVSSMS